MNSIHIDIESKRDNRESKERTDPVSRLRMTVRRQSQAIHFQQPSLFHIHEPLFFFFFFFLFFSNQKELNPFHNHLFLLLILRLMTFDRKKNVTVQSYWISPFDIINNRLIIFFH